MISFGQLSNCLKCKAEIMMSPKLVGNLLGAQIISNNGSKSKEISEKENLIQ